MATVTSPASPLLLDLLHASPLVEVRRLCLEETDDGVVLTGTVATFYAKQLAQEALRTGLDGRPLKNRVQVLQASRGR